jgi:hypothetical protein
MSGRSWAFAAFASIFALLHCGGSVEVVNGGGGSAGSAGRGGQSGHAGHVGLAGAGSGGLASPRDAGFDEYVDPGCPDAAPPPEVMECDPFSADPTCLKGEGCYPFVDHPFGAGCGTQSFGTQCLRAGVGRQGDDCTDGSSGCASGFVCVVGSEPGKHCVQLCKMGVQNSCPAGLICGELDVEGYGVCS